MNRKIFLIYLLPLSRLLYSFKTVLLSTKPKSRSNDKGCFRFVIENMNLQEIYVKKYWSKLISIITQFWFYFFVIYQYIIMKTSNIIAIICWLISKCVQNATSLIHYVELHSITYLSFAQEKQLLPQEIFFISFCNETFQV